MCHPGCYCVCYLLCGLRGWSAPPLQVFDEYDEEVQDAEAAETAAGQRREEKDSELKPFKLADRCGGKCEGNCGSGVWGAGEGRGRRNRDRVRAAESGAHGVGTGKEDGMSVRDCIQEVKDSGVNEAATESRTGCLVRLLWGPAQPTSIR